MLFQSKNNFWGAQRRNLNYLIWRNLTLQKAPDWLKPAKALKMVQQQQRVQLVRLNHRFSSLGNLQISVFFATVTFQFSYTQMFLLISFPNVQLCWTVSINGHDLVLLLVLHTCNIRFYFCNFSLYILLTVHTWFIFMQNLTWRFLYAGL